MDEFIKKINQYLGTKRHRQFVMFMCALVVFVTTYSLILPAVSISKETAEEEPGIVLNETSEEIQEMTDEVAEETTEEITEEPEVIEYEEPAAEKTKEEEISTEEPVTELQENEPEEVLLKEIKTEKEKDYTFVLESSFSANAEMELKETENDEWVSLFEKASEEVKKEEKEIFSARFFTLKIRNNNTEWNKNIKGTYTFYEPIELKENQSIVFGYFDDDMKFHEWDEKKLEFKTKEEKIEEIKFEAEKMPDNFAILVLDEIQKQEEVITEETTVIETQPQKETEYPAQTFEKSSNGITVKAVAEEGTFPEGTTMKVTPVKEEEIIDTVKDTVDAEVNSVQAVDITFYDKDGRPIEPLKPIQVSMTSEMIKETDTQSVVHIDDKGNGTVIEQNTDIESAEDEIIFDSDAFSVYVIVGTIEKTVLASDGHNYKITVSYGADAGIPEDADLDVIEILDGSESYQEYVSKTENALVHRIKIN